MKATGIVRRIDDLGRIVVPKEIRRTLRIREGDPLEIFTDREGEIILKKYSPIGELSQFAGEYAESLSQTTGYLVVITDCDHVVAVSGAGRKDFESKPISKQLEDAISGRKNFIASRDENSFIKITLDDAGDFLSQAVSTIICEGDAIGAVVLCSREEKGKLTEAEGKLAAAAAGFFGTPDGTVGKIIENEMQGKMETVGQGSVFPLIYFASVCRVCYTRTYIREGVDEIMKFIHIADVHLGVTPDVGKSWSDRRTKSIWETFAETVAEAGKQQVDFLLIAGDLFHKQPLKRELKEVNYLFSQIPQVKVVLMAGNHDYMQPKCYYLDFEWAENVYFFKEEATIGIDFPKENVTIYGMSYWHKKISEHYYDQLQIASRERINILLAHGGDDTHIPYSVNQVLSQGIDYIAAGHIHMGKQIVENKAVMAGALEPTESGDVGPHGYWIGEITKANGITKQSVHFYPVKKCEYCNEILAVTPQTTLTELKQQIMKLVDEGEAYKIYRLFLEGIMDAEQEYDFAQLEELERVAAVYVNLRPNYHYERMAKEYQGSLLGRYIEKMQKMPQDAVTKKAMEYGVSALLGYEICR